MSMKSISTSRRQFLQGSGIALSLPWLETFADAEKVPEKTPRRFLSVYHPD